MLRIRAQIWQQLVPLSARYLYARNGCYQTCYLASYDSYRACKRSQDRKLDLSSQLKIELNPIVLVLRVPLLVQNEVLHDEASELSLTTIERLVCDLSSKRGHELLGVLVPVASYLLLPTLPYIGPLIKCCLQAVS